MNRLPLLCLILITALISSCKNSYVLVFNPPATPGFEMEFRHSTQTNSEMKMSGQAQQETKTEIFEYRYRLDSIAADRTTHWSMKIQRMQVNQSASNGKSGHFDTAALSEEDSIGTAIWSRLLQANMHLAVDSTGKALHVSGLTAIFDSLELDFRSIPGSGEMINGMRQLLADSTILQMTREQWGYYPGKPVRKKQSWSGISYSGPNQCLQRETSYRLRTVTPGEAVLETSSRIVPVPGKIWEVDFGNLKVRYDLITQLSGDIRITRPDGLLRVSTLTLEQSGTYQMSGRQFPIARTVEIRNKTLEKIERIR